MRAKLGAWVACPSPGEGSRVNTTAESNPQLCPIGLCLTPR